MSDRRMFVLVRGKKGRTALSSVKLEGDIYVYNSRKLHGNSILLKALL
jgi:hypothetical protein